MNIHSPVESALFENTFSHIKTSTEHLDINEILKGQKRNVKSLIYKHIGKVKNERKPTPLKQLEEGLKKYFFGINGIVTMKIPKLISEYEREKNKRKNIFFSGSISSATSSPIFIHKKKTNKDISIKIKHTKSKSLNHKKHIRKMDNLLGSNIHTLNTYKGSTNIFTPKQRSINIDNQINSNIFTTLNAEPIHKHLLKTSKSVTSLLPLKTNTKITFDTFNNIKSIRSPIKKTKLHLNLNTTLSHKQIKLKEELTKMDISRQLLESKLFKISDDAHIQSQITKYLKSHVKKDMEDLSDNQFYAQPKYMYKTKTHFRDSQKTNEILSKSSKDMFAYEANFTLDKNPESIRLWKTRFKASSNLIFNSNLRNRAEDNYFQIHKWKYNVNLLKEELFQHYNEVNSNKK